MTNDTKEDGIHRQSRDHAGDMKKDTERAAKTLQSDLTSAADEVRKDAGRVADTVKEEAAAVGKQAAGMVNEQKNTMAAHLDGIAGAIRHAADDLESESSPAGAATREAAAKVGQLARVLRDNSIGDLVGIAEDFGRKQPVAFLGASMLAGFAASRFLVASGHRSGSHGAAGTDYRAQAGESSTGSPASVSQQQGGSL